MRNGTLSIGYTEENGWAQVRPTNLIRFTLTVNQLNELNLSGVGSVVVKALRTDNFQIVLSGAGSFSCEALDADTVLY